MITTRPGSAGADGTNDPLVFTTVGEDLDADISSYFVRGEGRSLLVDPGPDSHVESYLPQLRELVDPQAWLFVLVLSPLPGCLSGLGPLAGVARRRAAFLHWTVARSAEGVLRGWQVRSPGEGGAIPLGPGSRMVVRQPVRSGVAGAMLAYHDASTVLFTGPFFGSMGRGKLSGKPVLRRESVRAYTDVFTPGLDAGTVLDPFAGVERVSRIAPAHGKLATGGGLLVDSVFALDRRPASVPLAFYRLYLRIGGLLGEEAASSVFQAAGVPRPDLERGYPESALPDEAGGLWEQISGTVEQWLEGPALGMIRPLMGGLSIGVDAQASDRRQTSEGAEAPVRSGMVDGSGATDAVTGLPDGPALRRWLEQPEAAGPITVLMVSLDGIERINRRFGWSGGDDALYTVAYLLRNYRSARGDSQTHRPYKLAGPTFAYLVCGGHGLAPVTGPVTDATALATGVVTASAIAEEIRKTVAESAMFLERITVSIGVVTTDELQPGEADATQRAARLLEVAASRLAIARAAGMNTICAADPEAGATFGRGANVLIVDPDAPYLETLTRILNDRGYSVLVAEDGEHALQIISQIVPDVIVCEAMLPKFNGFTVRERLRHSSELSRMPFIMISHRKNDELIEKAALLGIVHFLRKPFSLVELAGLLDNLTRGR